MADAAGNHRRLPPPRRIAANGAARPTSPSRSGDLFEHFGVRGDRAVEPPAAIVAAVACSGCGWLCRIEGGEQGEGSRCPLCGAARPTSTISR